MEKPEYFKNEKVRGEVMRHAGYFMTESTGHLSEYLPYFRKNKAALDRYCDEPAFGGETGAYYKYCDMVAKKFAEVDVLAIESGEL
jgi:alpha-galactosidase